MAGTAYIKENSWEYCVNYFKGIGELKTFLQGYFKYVYVYSDDGLNDFALFVASQNKIEL